MRWSKLVFALPVLFVLAFSAPAPTPEPAPAPRAPCVAAVDGDDLPWPGAEPAWHRDARRDHAGPPCPYPRARSARPAPGSLHGSI